MCGKKGQGTSRLKNDPRRFELLITEGLFRKDVFLKICELNVFGAIFAGFIKTEKKTMDKQILKEEQGSVRGEGRKQDPDGFDNQESQDHGPQRGSHN